MGKVTRRDKNFSYSPKAAYVEMCARRRWALGHLARLNVRLLVLVGIRSRRVVVRETVSEVKLPLFRSYSTILGTYALFTDAVYKMRVKTLEPHYNLDF